MTTYRKLMLSLSLLLLAAPGTHGEPKSDELAVTTWGGGYAKSQILGFIRDYESESGVDVEVLEYPGGLEEVRSQVRSYNVKWDVVDFELFDAIQACREGLLVKIDHDMLPPAPDGTPASEDFIPGSLTECAVGSVIASTVVAYDRDQVDNAPGKIEDFFDPGEYPGRRGLRRTPQVNLEWALIADGVEPDRVYEVLETDDGVDRAFKILDRIKPHVIWWETGEQAIRLLETDSVAMTSVFNGRVYDAVERGEPFEILWDHQVWFLDVWGVLENGQRTERAMDFVRFATSTESLANQARYIPYGPVRKSSMAQVRSDIRERLPTAEGNFRTALEGNAEWWAEHETELTRRFERWVERPVMVPKDLPH